ncbi:uncharacterized protein LOC141863845 isoform X2 [Acropora palmata]|uniref:uncharacterized protein LOC141863845 isoform X2 n=1 Tax=Acropora palmata TaxID=6131 RepID=UPI003DA1529F
MAFCSAAVPIKSLILANESVRNSSSIDGTLSSQHHTSTNDEMETLSEEVFTTGAGYIKTRIYHNSFVVEEECTTIAVYNQRDGSSH